MDPFGVKRERNQGPGHGSISGDSLSSWGTSIFGDRMELNEEERACSVLVNNIPLEVSTDKIIIHFQSRRFGGGDVKSVLRPYGGGDDSQALVIFYEADVAEGVVDRVHIINKVRLEVKPMPPPEDTKIFTEVIAVLDKSIRHKLKSDLTQVFEELANQTDVEVTVKREGYLLKAENVDQLMEAEKILRHHCGLQSTLLDGMDDLTIDGSPIGIAPPSVSTPSYTSMPTRSNSMTPDVDSGPRSMHFGQYAEKTSPSPNVLSLGRSKEDDSKTSPEYSATFNKRNETPPYHTPFSVAPQRPFDGYRRAGSDTSQNTDDIIESWTKVNDNEARHQEQEKGDVRSWDREERVASPLELDNPRPRPIVLSSEEETFVSANSHDNNSADMRMKKPQDPSSRTSPEIVEVCADEMDSDAERSPPDFSGSSPEMVDKYADDSDNDSKRSRPKEVDKSRINPGTGRKHYVNVNANTTADKVGDKHRGSSVEEHRVTYDNGSSSDDNFEKITPKHDVVKDNYEEVAKDMALTPASPMLEDAEGAVGPETGHKASRSAVACSDEIMVDADFYHYLQEMKTFELHNIQRDHNVKIVDIQDGDQVRVVLMAEDSHVSQTEVESAHEKFGNLYQQEFLQSAIEVCELPDDQDVSPVQSAYETVKNMYTNILIRRTSERRTEFIGDSILAKQARYDFMQQAGIRGGTRGRRHYSPVVSDISAERYPDVISSREVSERRLDHDDKKPTDISRGRNISTLEEDGDSVERTSPKATEKKEKKAKPKAESRPTADKKAKRSEKEYKSIRHLHLKKTEEKGGSVAEGKRTDPGTGDVDMVDGIGSDEDKDDVTKVDYSLEGSGSDNEEIPREPVKIFDSDEGQATARVSSRGVVSSEIAHDVPDEDVDIPPHEIGEPSGKSPEDEASEAYIRELLQQEEAEREALRDRRSRHSDGRDRTTDIIDRRLIGELSAQVDDVLKGKHPDADVILNGLFRGGAAAGRPMPGKTTGAGRVGKAPDDSSGSGGGSGADSKDRVTPNSRVRSVPSGSEKSSSGGSAKSSDHAKVVEGKAPAKMECTICKEVAQSPKKLVCGHVFCKNCIELQFANYKAECPNCAIEPRRKKIKEGSQPLGGTMEYVIDEKHHLEGHNGQGTIVINYFFHPGKQTAEDPFPGERYSGLRRTAFLPNSQEGHKVLDRLQEAFRKRFVFKIVPPEGDSRAARLAWNINHKTELKGSDGYPDPAYLGRVKRELDGLGIEV